jgi:hypothetical protein
MVESLTRSKRRRMMQWWQMKMMPRMRLEQAWVVRRTAEGRSSTETSGVVQRSGEPKERGERGP